MRCVVQRVKEASVTVDGETVGKIGPGVLALIGVSTEDTDKDYKYILDKYSGCFPVHPVRRRPGRTAAVLYPCGGAGGCQRVL